MSMNVLWYTLFAVALAGLAFVVYSYLKIKRLPEGTAEMAELAGIIRSGAGAFLKTEFRSIAFVAVAVAAAITLFVEKSCGLTFLFGAAISGSVCALGMKSATCANVRAANVARESLDTAKTVKAALAGGSVSGLAVHVFGLAGFALIILLGGGIDPGASGSGLISGLSCNPTVMRLTTYSLGCSVVAMFNRVAGGNYTKAADISSDILAKLRHDLPEDDSRVPNVIADFIGDNVNDIAGNCSDLLESFVATMTAAILIAVTVFKATQGFEGIGEDAFSATVMFPLALAGCGLFSCLIGLARAAFLPMRRDPGRELDISSWLSAGLTVATSFFAAKSIFGGVPLYPGFRLGYASPWISATLGIASGIAIGAITEYYTSTEYRPTRELAAMATEGEAFVITKGDALGSRSCILPVVVIALALFVSGRICGTYGIAVAALGMLSFVGTTVSIDAFGPIADNAGGFAESCRLDKNVRAITDRLDAVGNTTAAIGKGFAIGSAAFATVSLISAYVGSYTAGGAEAVLNFASFPVIAGGLVGGALIEYFTALLTDNTIDAAREMADEGDRIMSIPGVLEGTVRPDYDRMITIAAKNAINKMVLPSVLALLIPLAGGFLFGPEFVGGLLIGATLVAIPRAIFMGNSGGAFDNAKKYIESGKLSGFGKGSDAHKASVTGDTVGDTRKDVVGVALDIFIKTMSTVANTLATLFAHYCLLR